MNMETEEEKRQKTLLINTIKIYCRRVCDEKELQKMNMGELWEFYGKYRKDKKPNTDKSKTHIINRIMMDCYMPYGGIDNILTPPCGNKENPNWYWNRKALEVMDIDEVEKVYEKYKRVKC